jgi:hypothetical protein
MEPWRIVLWAAVVFNLVVGAGGLAQRGAAREARLVALLVLAFAIVYAFVALDPARYAPVLWAGVFGKLGVIAIMLPAVARREAPRTVGWLLAGDAMFIGFFAVLLLSGAL